MNSLLKISNDLKIEIALSFIQKYENTTKIISEQNSIIQSLDNLFKLLYQIKKYSMVYVKNIIIDSFWITTNENVKELDAFILQVIRTDFQLHSSMLDLLIELNKEANDTNYLNILIPFISKKLFESFEMYISSCAFIYKMYQKGIISKVKIINEKKLYCKLSMKKL